LFQIFQSRDYFTTQNKMVANKRYGVGWWA